MKTDSELDQAGFTESGKSRYKNTSIEYSDTLFTKAAALGDMDKAKGMPREVTHEHVRSATHAIASSFGKEGNSRAVVFCQVGEYVAAAGVGVGGGKLDQTWGIFLFGLSILIGIILFVSRNTGKI